MPNFDVVFDIAQKAGAASGLIFALMWWLERKERFRLQRVLEGYLIPMVERTERVMRGVRRVVGDGDDD